MRRNLLLILPLLLLLLTGCAAPHVRAQGDLLVRRPNEGREAEAVVTLKPVPTAAPATPTPTPVPATPTPEPATPEPVTPSPTPAQVLAEPDRSEGQKYVYLTFDDGPSKNTQEILAILNEKGVHATFFLVGEKAAERREEEGGDG